MKPKLPYEVYAHVTLIAKFADELEACAYAKTASISRCSTEVVLNSKKAAGIVAQYENGRTAPEFLTHEWARRRSEAA